MCETQYRLYPDGSVVHEDEFEELDFSGSCSDDYKTVSVPDLVVDYIVESFFPADPEQYKKNAHFSKTGTPASGKTYDAVRNIILGFTENKII